MNDHLNDVRSLWNFVDWEPYLIIVGLCICNWLFFKFFLHKISQDRNRVLKKHFQSLASSLVVLSIFFGACILLKDNVRTANYFGFFTLYFGMYVLVKAARLFVLQYLFRQSMQEGVPILLVNVFSLLFSLGLLFWSLSRVFGIQVGPLATTSAAFSLILGLAAQDTLGNLFAGLSLQVDKNFEIGDWIEVVSGVQKTVGQVREITWRSVLLIGFSDEQIVIPNRIIAQAHIYNFSPPDQPILRSQIFRVPFDSPVDAVKEALGQAAAQVSEVKGIPAPFAYIQETTESWIQIKLIYFIDSYGSQFLIGDKVVTYALKILAEKGIRLTHNQLRVQLDSPIKNHAT